MRSGYWVMAIFATGWASAGLRAAGYAPVTMLLPALVSAALLVWAYRVPATGGAMPRHTRALLTRWSLIEGLAIAIAVPVLHRTHHPDAVFPVVAVIVGLHFVPLARAIPVRAYYGTAAALVAIGLAGMLVPAGERPLAVGVGAALVLWGTAVYRLLTPPRSVAA